MTYKLSDEQRKKIMKSHGVIGQTIIEGVEELIPQIRDDALEEIINKFKNIRYSANPDTTEVAAWNRAIIAIQDLKKKK